MLRGLNRAEKAGQDMGKRYKAIEDHLVGTPSATPGQAGDVNAPTHVAPVTRFLRPPGSGSETDFTSTCTACGACVTACPAEAIVIDEHQASGRPYILPRISPCVMSNDVSCTKACPSGALTVLNVPAKIHLGVAKIDHARCLRTPAQTVSRGATLAAEDCTVCVSQCPVGETALAINEDDELVVRDACTGCGVCERACPTEPTSIWIIPKAQMGQI